MSTADFETMKLFWIEPQQIHDNVATLTSKDSYHLARVLRYQEGDCLELTDGNGHIFSAEISSISKDKLQVIAKVLSSREAKGLLLPQLHLAPALFKGPRMDWMIEKVSELGVHQIHPILTEHSVIKIHSPAENLKKVQRWQSLTQSALKQSGQGWLPQIESILKWNDFLQQCSSYAGPKLLFTPESKKPFPEWEKILLESKADRWLACIGPEGGFSPTEIKAAKQNGFITCSLGQSTLRAETASIVALTLLNSLKQKI